LNILLENLSDFINGKSNILKKQYRNNPIIFHYYQEIVRNWNKLNFIINKTIRSLKDPVEITPFLRVKLFYYAYLIFYESYSIGSVIKDLEPSNIIIKIIKRFKSFSWTKALKGKTFKEKLSLEEAIPTFFIDRLLPVMSKDFLYENVKSMSFSANKNEISFRINDLVLSHVERVSVDSIVDNLKKDGMPIFQGNINDLMFSTESEYKNKLILSDWYKKGYIIIHDRASFMISQLLSPKPNELICDMCAAPGIKTSIIAQISRNRSKIIACDFSMKRLLQMKTLIKKLQVVNCFLFNLDSTTISRYFQNLFDKILIDAPCTGSGTFLNHPELKWRQNYTFLNQNIILQEKMIQSGLNLLKSGGVMVYSTCSLYPEEGEYQIEKVLEYLEPLDIPNYFSPSYKINGTPLEGTGRLFPSIHNTQGFFVSKLKKR
jgi:16S rRNA (cytosine967-C5)-methyltransferase